MVACYCRVSTKSQRTAAQRADIERWLKANGISRKVVRWFEDAESGTTLRRPAFERLQQEIFQGSVKTVVVWKLDRISRRLRDGINLLADWCDRGIRVIVVTQQIDLTGTVGRMVASVMFGLAEIELEFRRERQAIGIALAKRHGAYHGRRPGTTKANRTRAQQLQSRGLTSREIANALHVSERTVFRYLQ